MGKATVGDALQPGDRIGHYVIESELGRGPLGISYRARDASGEIVALKVLSAQGPLTDEQKAKIAHDFHALEDLHSPQVPVLVEFVRYDDFYVIATDYLPLGDFSHRLEQGPLPLPTALTLIRHLTYAVGRAHAIGVVHGGIKPTNILRGESHGRQVPVLSDFGGALREHPWVRPEGVSADDAYRAPELTDGAPITPASDVFSLGTLLAVMTGGLANAGVAGVIARATVGSPAQRYADASQMYEALSSVGSTPDPEVGAAVPVAAAAKAPKVDVPVDQAPSPEPPAEASNEEEPTDEAPATEEPTTDEEVATEPSVEQPVAAARRVSEPIDPIGFADASMFVDGVVVPEADASRVMDRAAERARILRSADVAASERGYRSKGPLIAAVVAAALLVLALSLLLSKNNVFNQPHTVPTASVLHTSSLNDGKVRFDLAQPAMPSDDTIVRKLQVLTNSGTWQDVSGTSYTASTPIGGKQVCVKFRIDDVPQDGTAPTSGAEVPACGTTGPTLTVSVDTNPCNINGVSQVCYTFAADGLKPHSTDKVTLLLDGQVLGTRSLTVNGSGHASLPPGQHFYFDATSSGKYAVVKFAGLSKRFLIVQ